MNQICPEAAAIAKRGKIFPAGKGFRMLHHTRAKKMLIVAKARCLRTQQHS
jgi:hypothetical protein